MTSVASSYGERSELAKSEVWDVDRVRQLFSDLGESKLNEKRLISGHWGGASIHPDLIDPAGGIGAFTMKEIEFIHRESGKWVGLIGADLCASWVNFEHAEVDFDLSLSMHYDEMIRPLIDYWNEGGLVALNTHLYGPKNDGTYITSWEIKKWSPEDTDAILTPGTVARKNYLGLLDRMAEPLLQLQEAGVVVVWRPFHELYGRWFWWGTESTSPEQYQRLWIDMHTYFSNQKSLKNLLWFFNSSQARNPDRYPGDAYVDLYGPDIYENEVQADAGGENRPWAFGEIGKIGDYESWLEKLKAEAPYTVFFMTWDRQWGPVGHPGANEARRESAIPSESYFRMIEDPWIIDRSTLMRMR